MKLFAIAFAGAVSTFAGANDLQDCWETQTSEFATLALEQALNDDGVSESRLFRVSGAVSGLVVIKNNGETREVSNLADEEIAKIFSQHKGSVEEVYTFTDQNSGEICVTEEDGECQSARDIALQAAKACATGATGGFLTTRTPQGVVIGCGVGAAVSLTQSLMDSADCTKK